MKKTIAALVLALAATAAYACTTFTFIRPDGTVVICTTCCVEGNCVTVCN